MFDFFLSLFATTAYACSVNDNLTAFVALFQWIFLILIVPACLILLILLRLRKKYRVKGWWWALKKTLVLAMAISILVSLSVGGFILKQHFEIQDAIEKGQYPLC